MICTRCKVEMTFVKAEVNVVLNPIQGKVRLEEFKCPVCSFKGMTVNEMPRPVRKAPDKHTLKRRVSQVR